MKGTDCTRAQLEAASAFLVSAGWGPRAGRRVTTRADVLRLLAWYAELRTAPSTEPRQAVRHAQVRLPRLPPDQVQA